MEKLNLYQKIVEVRKSIGTFNKDKKGHNFSYVTGDQILGKMKEKMNELGLILQPSTEVGQWQRHDYKTQYDKAKIDFIVWGQATYTWINADNPTEREAVPFAYYGQQGDDLSQAYGTALTYTERYFLLKYFGIATDGDDADARRQTQKGNEQPITPTKPPVKKDSQLTQKDKDEIQKIEKEKLEPVSEETITAIVAALDNKHISVDDFMKELGITDIKELKKWQSGEVNKTIKKLKEKPPTL